MFSRPEGVMVGNRATRGFVRGMLDATLSEPALNYLYAATAFVGLSYALRAPGRSLVRRGAAAAGRLFVLAAALLHLGAMLSSCSSLTGRAVLPLVPEPIRPATARWTAAVEPYFRRVDMPQTGRGDAAAVDIAWRRAVDIAWRRVAATPRLRRG